MKAKTKSPVRRFLRTALLLTSIGLTCSCATEKHYKLAFAGPRQAAEEATFIARPGRVVVTPLVISIDGHKNDIDGHSFRLVGVWNHTLQARLLPGTHKLIVNVQPAEDSTLMFSGFPDKHITFEAIAGRSYELKVNAVNFRQPFFWGHVQWEAKVIEAETGKEFPSDESLSQNPPRPYSP